jgi:hypothetical protein
MREDLAHHIRVGELCDEAAGGRRALGHEEIAPSGGGREHAVVVELMSA